jgi:hypothetical protein
MYASCLIYAFCLLLLRRQQTRLNNHSTPVLYGHSGQNPSATTPFAALSLRNLSKLKVFDTIFPLQIATVILLLPLNVEAADAGIGRTVDSSFDSTSSPMVHSKAFLALPLEPQRYVPLNPSQRQLEVFQDSRLDLCVDRGKKWENCFFFGVGGIDSVSSVEGKSKAPTPRIEKSKTTPLHQRPQTW